MAVGDQEQTAQPARRAWEPPEMRELVLRTAAADDRLVAPAPPPALPGEPPLTKLGFAFEASFPLSARTYS